MTIRLLMPAILLAACHAALECNAFAEKPSVRKRADATHYVVRNTPYYVTGPQQARPADGTFQAGTRVRLLRQAGSYALVRSGAGVRAYVSTSAIAKVGAVKVPADVLKIAEGNNRFTFDLYRRLSKQPGNLFFSPASISTALAMTYAGAEGRTEQEMARVLHFTLPEPRLHAAQRDARTVLDSGGKKRGYELSIANRLWGQKGYGFRPDYLKTTATDYGAALAELDFVRNSAAARDAINGWVERETRGKIRDLIPRGALGPMTRLVLTNAIYFKGDWTKKFDPRNTKNARFHVSPEKKVTAPLMFQKHRFGYAAFKDVQLLALPYGKEKHLSMVVLLPKSNDGLPALEKSLDADALAKRMSRMRPREVKVYLPKFKMTARFELGATLKALGMPTAFTPGKADFSGMATSEKLYISAVIHKAFVDVNEKGTEAAAATGVIIKATAAPPPPPVFRADHPFLFLIRDNRTGTILFVGRVVNPAG